MTLAIKFKDSRLAQAALIAALGLSACSRKEEAATTPSIEVARSELTLRGDHLFRNGQTNYFTGLMVEHYPEGQLQSRSVISNGVLWGVSEGWHTNGQMQVREYFKAGVSEGVRTKWETNGVKVSEALIVAGKLNGTFRRWHADGILSEEVEMKDGNPDGLSRAWYPSGCLKAEVQMAAGKVLEQKYWKDGEVPGKAMVTAKLP